VPEADDRDSLAHAAAARHHFKALSTHPPAVARESKPAVTYLTSSHVSHPFPPQTRWLTSVSANKRGAWWHRRAGGSGGRGARSVPLPPPSPAHLRFRWETLQL